jgi:ethanolamine utilization protein EutN
VETGPGDPLVAFDVLGSGQGERVLIVQGSVAAGWLPGKPPVDALIIGYVAALADADAMVKAANRGMVPGRRSMPRRSNSSR